MRLFGGVFTVVAPDPTERDRREGLRKSTRALPGVRLGDIETNITKVIALGRKREDARRTESTVEVRLTRAR